METKQDQDKTPGASATERSKALEFAETLSGDIIQNILDVFRPLKRGWHDLVEPDQSRAKATLELVVRNTVSAIFGHVIGQTGEYLTVKVGDHKTKGTDIKAEFVVHADPDTAGDQILLMVHRAKRIPTCTLLLTSPKAFMGASIRDTVFADQGEMFKKAEEPDGVELEAVRSEDGEWLVDWTARTRTHQGTGEIVALADDEQPPAEPAPGELTDVEKFEDANARSSMRKFAKSKKGRDLADKCSPDELEALNAGRAAFTAGARPKPPQDLPLGGKAEDLWAIGYGLESLAADKAGKGSGKAAAPAPAEAAAPETAAPPADLDPTFVLGQRAFDKGEGAIIPVVLEGSAAGQLWLDGWRARQLAVGISEAFGRGGRDWQNNPSGECRVPDDIAVDEALSEAYRQGWAADAAAWEAEPEGEPAIA